MTTLPVIEYCLRSADPLTDLAMQVLEVVQHPLHQLAERCRQLATGVLDELRHTLPDIRDAFGHDQAELAQQAADLVGLRSARLDQALTHRVQRQYGLLLDTFDRNEAHVWSGHCLTDRLGIGDIVLIRFHVGLDELWRHQAHGVSKTLEFSSPMMRTATRFHTNQAPRQLGKECRHLVTFDLLPQHGLASLIDTVYLEHIFCKVNANRRNLHNGRSPRFKW